MRAHQIDQNGIIVNTIEVDDLKILPNLIDASIGGGIGDKVVNGAVIPAVPVVDKAAHNAAIYKQLEQLDISRSRPLADCALGNGDVATGADNLTPKQRLEAIEVQRAALVAKLL